MTNASKPKQVIRDFVRFAERVCGVRLTRGQRVLARVAFDGVDPFDLEGDERAMARELFGDVERIPASARAVVAIVAGGRGGKTYLTALRLLHAALVVPVRLAPGEIASGLFVAPDLRLARQGVRYARGAGEASPAMRGLVEDANADGFTIRRPDGVRVRIEALPATRGGSAVRGRTLVGAMLDEAAFFRDEATGIVNDAEVFRAVAPRVVAGGQVVIGSTPWTEAGLLFETFTTNRAEPRTAIAVHAPTLLLRRGDATIEAMVARETERDPDNARREFGAEFMGGGAGTFFDPSAVEAAALDVLPPHEGWRVVAGVDLAFRSDASALVVLAVAPTGDRYVVLHREEVRPQRGAPLSPSGVAAKFASTLATFKVSEVACDLFYVEAAREALSRYGIAVLEIPAGVQGKGTIYTGLRVALHEGRMALPKDRALLAQLRSVIAKPTPGGMLSISIPRRAGGHGDSVAALAAALWLTTQRSGALVPPEVLARIRTKNVHALTGPAYGERRSHG